MLRYQQTVQKVSRHGLPACANTATHALMAIDLMIIERLGGLDYVAGRIGMTANGLRRYTLDNAEVPPARQRQIMALAEELGKRVNWRDFHRRVATPRLHKGKIDGGTGSPGRDDGGGGSAAFVY